MTTLNILKSIERKGCYLIKIADRNMKDGSIVTMQRLQNTAALLLDLADRLKAKKGEYPPS